MRWGCSVFVLAVFAVFAVLAACGPAADRDTARWVRSASASAVVLGNASDAGNANGANGAGRADEEFVAIVFGGARGTLAVPEAAEAWLIDCTTSRAEMLERAATAGVFTWNGDGRGSYDLDFERVSERRSGTFSAEAGASSSPSECAAFKQALQAWNSRN